MVQLLAQILFFYVFVLGAIALTGYVAWVIVRFFKEAQRKNGNGGSHG